MTIALGRGGKGQESKVRYSAVVLTSVTVTLGLALLAQPAGASPSQPATRSSTTPSRWQIQQTPALSVKDGQFDGISCTSIANCVAVGYRLNGKGEQVALAERWDGTSWSMTKAASPAGAEQTELSSVSCVSESDCVAVGQSEVQPVAELWNGSTWTLEAVSTKPSFFFASLTGVSCLSADECRAVGMDITAKGEQEVLEALAETWNGTAWTRTKVPMPSGAVGTSFGSVSCTSTGHCEAVGSYEVKSEDTFALAESWTDAGIEPQQTKNPNDSYSELTSVSCVSASDCVAVGIGVANAFSETWNGSLWKLVRTPKPSDGVGTFLSGVSCSSSTTCMAVGSYASNSGVEETLAMNWDGTAWTIEPSPSPSSVQNDLLSVACTSESACTAAGIMTGATNAPLLLVEVWNGTSWSTQHAFLKNSKLGAGLFNVSCTSTSFCLAVGSDALQDPIAEIWNGTDWKVTPPPGEGDGGGFSDVACTTETDCIAVGPSYTQEAGLAEQWNGKSWTVLQTPTVGGNLESVSCRSAKACIAVGTTFDIDTGASVALAESWNGTEWSLMKTPGTEKGSIETELLSVSCGAAQSCVAVGVSVNDEDIGSPLVESWNGTKWSIDKSAATSASNLGLTGVSCTSAGNCMATGYAFNRIGSPVAFSEVWNGKAWTSEKIPTPSGGAVIYGLQCSSANACVTVGGSGKGALAEGWDGKDWTVLKPVNPPGSGTSTFLVGVDCTSSKACTAVGYYENKSGLELTLAEAN